MIGLAVLYLQDDFLVQRWSDFLVVLLTHVLAKERTARIELLGWICVVLSTSVFAAPLSIIVSIYAMSLRKHFN